MSTIVNGFAATQSPTKSGCGRIAVLKALIPGIATGGSVTFEGGPWRSLMLVTPASDFDALNPPAAGGQVEFTITLDDDRELIANAGYHYKGLGPFKKITCRDRRTGGFIRLDVRLIVASDPDFFMFCREWI